MVPIATSNNNPNSNVVTGHLPLYASPNNRVWVEDKEEGYVDAQLITTSHDGKDHESEDMVTIQYADLTTKLIPRNAVQLMNPPKYQFASDLADLTYLNEGSVLHNLKHRYINNAIYTYSGLFLVAINPYKWLPIYTENDIRMYKNKKRSESPPHIYAIADQAYHQMMENDENQSILITGESGAGKTENTKKVIQYITAIASKQNSNTSDSLDVQILCANPILEAFGNAQTIKNNNSSRFGKFIRLEFNDHGILSGANIERYLLEKSRVTHQNPKERSFHIFYQFLKGAPKNLKDKLHVYGTVDDYEYVKHSKKDVEGVDDVEDFHSLIKSMNTMAFTEKEMEQFFTIIAIILHLGNIQVKDDRDGQAKLTGDENPLNYACSLLQVPIDHFVEALLRPQLRAGKEVITQGRNAEQVKDSIETICRALYDRMFGVLVNRINQTLDKPMLKHHFIGVLDIAGFEIFEKNSFEQLCINYTNEKLQQFFNHHMFILEQEEYQRERVDWQFVDFGLDLQPTIDLIEKSNPIGVLALLDEDCVMPKATDKSFTEKLHGLWGKGKSDKYDVPRYAPSGFHLVHYAGKVEYHTEGWLDKNKDPVNESLASLIARSQDKFIAELFQDWLDDPQQTAQTKRQWMGGSFRTVSQKYKEQLSYLMSQLNKTQPHFVRCILPNEFKKPSKINARLVLDQLKCNGVLEGIRICRQGYPNRISFPVFRQRYEVLSSDPLDQLGAMDYMVDGAKAVDHILKQCSSFIDPMQYKIGLTKVFFRAGTLGVLEQAREDKIGEIMREFQIACQAFMARRRYKRRSTLSRAVTTIQKNARVYIELKEWQWWKLWTKLRPLLNVTRIDKEMKEREQKVKEWEDKYSEECVKRESLEKQIVLVQQERKSLEMELAYEREALKDSQDVLSGIRCRLNQMESELEQKIISIKQLEERSTTIAHEKQSLQEILSNSIKQVESLKQSYDTLSKEKDRLQENLSIQEKSTSLECSRLQSLLSKTQSDLSNEQEIASTTQSLLSQRTRDYESLTEKYNSQIHFTDQLEREKQTLSHQLVQIKSERDAQQERIASLTSELEKKSRELENLVKKHNHLESEYNSLRDQYEEKDGLYRKNLEQLDIANRNLDQEKRLRQLKETELKDLVYILDQKEGELGVQQDKMKQLREHEIASLEKQVNQLQELLDSRSQMGKEEADRLKNRVQVLEHDLEHQKRTIHNQESLLEETKHAWQSETQSKKILEQQKRQLSVEHDQLSNTLNEKERQLASNSQHIQTLERKLEQLNTQKTSMAEQFDTLERQLQTLTATVHQQNSDLDFYKERVSLLEESKKKWAQDINDLTAQLNEEANNKKELLSNYSGKISSLEEKICQQLLVIEDKNTQLETSQRETSLLKSDLTQYHNTIQILEKTKSRQAGELYDSRLELERIQVHCNALERQAKLQDGKITTLTNEFEEKKKQIDMFEQEIKKVKSKYNLELEEKQLQLDLLQKSKDALEREHKTLTQLMASQDDLDSGNMNNIESLQLKQEISELQEKISILQEEKQTFSVEKKQLEQDLQNIQRIHEQDLHSKSIQMEEQRKTLFKEIQDLRTKLESETTSRLEATKAKKKLETELTNLSSTLDNERIELERKAQKGMVQIKELQAKLVTEECLRRALEESNSRNDKCLAEAHHQLDLAHTMQQVAEQGRKSLEERVARLDSELAALMDEKCLLFDEKKQLEKKISRMESEFNEKMMESIRDSEQKVSQIERSKFKLQNELESTMDALKKLREELVQTTSIHDSKTKTLQLDLDGMQKRHALEIERYEQQIQTWKDQLEDQERVISSLDSQSALERNQVLEQVKSKQMEIDRLESEQEGLKATISDLLHQIEEYQLVSGLEKENAKLEYEKLKTGLLEEYQEKEQESRSNITELKRLAEELNQDLLHEKSVLHQLELDQKKLKQVNIEQELVIRKHNEQLLIIKKEKEMFSNQVEILQLSLREMRSRLDESTEKSSRTETIRQQLLQQFNDLERSHRQVLESLELKDGKLSELLTGHQSLLSEKAKLNQSLIDIQNEHKMVKELLEQQKEIMDERQSRLDLFDEQLAKAHQQLQEEQARSYDLVCKNANLEHSLREYHHAKLSSIIDASTEDDNHNRYQVCDAPSTPTTLTAGHKQSHARPASTLSSSSTNTPVTHPQSSMKQQLHELHGLLQVMAQEKALLSKTVKTHEKSLREITSKLQDKEKHLKRSIKECEALKERLQIVNHPSKLISHYRLSSPTGNQNSTLISAPQATISCQVVDSLDSICDQDQHV